jgi:uncharacterized protein YgiB involved in biofilm formation
VRFAYYAAEDDLRILKKELLMKRSKAIALTLIASASLVSCAEEQLETQRTQYRSRAECEADWGVGDDRCRDERGAYFGPHFLFFGGRPFFYPYGANGLAASQPVAAPSSARFDSSGRFLSSSPSAMNTTGVTRGGFGRTARGFFVGLGG